jgi:para-nitrobenzyl esterase
VKNNIANFGGDTNNITIFGESAGGYNVAALLSSTLAEGYFIKQLSKVEGSSLVTSPILRIYQ